MEITSSDINGLQKLATKLECQMKEYPIKIYPSNAEFIYLSKKLTQNIIVNLRRITTKKRIP